MSLNGLDDAAIVEAHEAATSEPAGWFLLKYSNRDEVELLSRGNGDVAEMRNAVSDYHETSPLYGFLKYRRRKVIIKYLPEDCSRLIQARSAVHFNAICERFSPYDTTFEIATAGELKDTKLSSACSLHAASCSTSSSTSSLRRRRLGEIVEEEEEEQRASKRQSTHESGKGRPKSSAAGISVSDPVALDSHLAAFPEHSEFSAVSTSELPTFVGVDGRPPSSARSTDADLTQSRPDLFTYPTHPYSKPKVKLGPRPSLDVSGRPRTAGNFRPISAIPAGFKLFGKGNKKAAGSQNRNSAAATVAPHEEAASLDHDATGAGIPEEFQWTTGETARPVTSSGASTVQTTMPPPPTPKKPTVSSEKARLMKAMQLREKKKQMALQPPVTAPSSNDAPPEGQELPTEASEKTAQKAEAETEASHYDDEDVIKADAGAMLQMTSSLHTDQRSDLTQSDSRPASPVVASSEADHSTKASSLLESLEDNVRANGDEPASDDGVCPQSPPIPDVEVDAPAAQWDVHAAHKTGSEEAVLGPERQDCIHDCSQTAAASEEWKVVDEWAAESDVRAASSTASDATVAAAAVPPDSDVALDSSASECVTRKVTSLPVSKFSVDIPTLPKPRREAPSSDEDSKTLEIPTAAPAVGEVADADGKFASPQWKSPDSHVSTLYSPEPKVAAQATVVSPTPLRALRTSLTAASDSTCEVTTAQGPEDCEAETKSGPEGQPRRKGHVEPIRTDLANHSRQTSHSAIDFSDDEELMEELQSATLQEAKPMVVAKTPVSTTFSTSPLLGRTTPNAQPAHVVRTISNPVRGNLITPTDVSQSSARSVSTGAAYLHQVTQQQHQQQGGNLAKKPNIGSGISQRIKALEKLSAPSGEPAAPAPNPRERPSSTFFAVKKRDGSNPSSVVERTNSLRKGIPDSRPQSKDSSSESGMAGRRERSGSVTDRLSLFESSGGAANTTLSRPPSNPRRGRLESVSVTAKIVRDPSQGTQAGFEPPRDPSEYGRLELKQSPLLVDHHEAMPEPTPAAAGPCSERRRSASEERTKSSKSRQSSLSIVKDFIKERRKSVASSQGDGLGATTAASQSRSPSRSPPVLQSSTFSPRLSISSHRSSFSRDRESVTSPTGESVGDDGKSANGDKKLSRAGRFMRRLSTLSGSRSKNSSPGISDTVAEEDGTEAEMPRPATTGSPTTVSYMGDVNIQFPDTLLWKRRNLSLDSQGFLILSALPAQSGRQAQGIKRYHLSEFRAPYIPDVEVQELPNSVVLDFVEGASIQVACEDRAGQVGVLNVLREAHATRGSTYGL